MMNQGALFAQSNKQKLNTRSSTEAELVGVNDAMTMILWMKRFIEAQGYPVLENVINQDNESSMKLEEYGRQSSGKKTRHLDIRYYFVTDNVNKGAVQIRYCPTRDMTTDFFTKPLQGTLFKNFRDQILNITGTPIHAPAPAPRSVSRISQMYHPAMAFRSVLEHIVQLISSTLAGTANPGYMMTYQPKSWKVNN